MEQASAQKTALRVTVVVPVRDEASTVGMGLESLARQTIGAESMEVLVYDGGSLDGTADACRSFASAHPWGRFEVLANAWGTVPYALNAGLTEGTSEWFAVLAGRTTLSADYLETCIAAAERGGEGVGVGGRLVAVGAGGVPGAIAAVVTHPLGVGRGFRTDEVERDVGHHPFAVWRRRDVLRFGGFDTALERNQDDEFSMRAIRRGARIRLLPGPVVRYRPRDRYRGLAVQYFQYGLWKSAVGLRFGLFPPRSLAPAAVTAGFASALAMGLTGRTRLPLLSFVATYALAGSAVARRRGSNPLLTSVALALVHLSYGAGVISGALRPGLVSSSIGSTRFR
jgi:glycosyltransferase involved in cell wall biosynthesis